MARAGRKDRGLVPKCDADGKIVGWIVRLYHEGRDRRFGTFPTKTEARDFYEKAKQEQKVGRFFPERYQHGGYEFAQETIERYMAHNTNKSRSQDDYYARWWKDRLAGNRLNQIRPAAIEEAKRDLVAKAFAPQTVLHYLKFLRHVLNIAIRDGKLERNPVAQVKLPTVSTGRTRYLSPAEEATLLEALGPVHAPWARLAILTGLRREEQFSLRWAQVDLERGVITLPQTKVGQVQYVPLNEEAKALLRGMNTWLCSPWVFPSQNPATHLDARHFYSRVWIPAVKTAGIEWCTWHDLRHTFASRLAMSGASEGTIATLLRHSSTALVRRYTHLSPSHLKAAVEGVASFGKEQEAQPVGVPRGGPTGQISSPTVTKFGTAGGAESSGSAKDVEKVGAPDRI
jgi:integrase